jgi:hypothetical protein
MKSSGNRDRVRTTADIILDSDEASLLDVVDNALNNGVVLSGDLTIGLAQVDLVYARLSLLLCAADRVLPADRTSQRRSRTPRHRLTPRSPRKQGRS